jgi:hypothetical protein
MTDLSKRVSRRTNATIREAGKARRIVVTLYPNGTIGLRPEKTRREELLSVEAAWSWAVKARVAEEKQQRRRGK